MEFQKIKNYIEKDLSNYNLIDERKNNNETRDSFMKFAFIIFIIAITLNTIYLIYLKNCSSIP